MTRAGGRGWTLAVACLLLSSCTGGGDNVRVGPIYERTRTADGGTRWLVRPFVSVQKNESKSEVTVLWPLIRATSEGKNSHYWLFPIWRKETFVSEVDGRDMDMMMLPGIFYGTDDRHGTYFMFFPIGGTVEGLLGKEHIDVALFPLWARVRDRGKSSHHVLWPFINFVIGERDRGFRIFPLYARFSGENALGEPRYERFSLLWPFFHRSSEFLDTRDPRHTWMFLPFYGQTESNNVSRRTVLFPIVQYEYNRKYDQSELTVFPFKFGWGKDLAQMDLFPLVGHRVTPTLRRHWVLWPIHRYELQTTGAYESESMWIAPIYWRHTRRFHADHTEEKRVRLWPLYSHYENRDGSERTAILDLLPFFDPAHFEPHYARFWQLYRSEKRTDDSARWELLWGFLRGKRDADSSYFSLLGGVFSRHASERGTRWRILFIPFRT